MQFQRTKRGLGAAMMALVLALSSGTGFASSHMDAPLITLDDAANTTDVYAFRSASEDGKTQYLTTALAVYPFEEPGIGPNKYDFDDNVLYQIHVALGDDVDKGRKTLSYQFYFRSSFRNPNTILQKFTGPVGVQSNPAYLANTYTNVNFVQTYKVFKVNHRTGRKTYLGTGIVPPNNQGLVTPLYNKNNNGEMLAKGGVATETALDAYTKAAIRELARGYRAFAGQRDDGFYADIQSIFDLDFTFGGPNKPFDSQGGFNLHTIVLQIPLAEMGNATRAGVYATTSRQKITIRSSKPQKRGDFTFGQWIQVGRQGNPLFAEALVAIKDKDLYNRTEPTRDRDLFAKYALRPELAAVLQPLLGLPDDRLTNRTDIAGIYIPDVIKVALDTGPVPLAGNPDESGFHRLSVFAGDAGGWPNGRRFGDDVVDVAVCAIASDLRDPANLDLACDETANIDKVLENDITYNSVMPYAATPLNGRNHGHHGQ